MLGLTLAGFGCKATDQKTLARTKPFTIKVWSVYDDSELMDPIFQAYRRQHPNISFEFRKFRFDEYEKAVLDGMAEDQGPDILALHNTWLRGWQPRLLPAPAVLNLPFRETVGTIKKEVVTTLRDVPAPSIKSVANDFVDVVSSDVVIPTEQEDPRLPLIPRVYALPMAVDTMVVYYNRDILNASGIAQPATGWREFQEQVKKITKLDQVGNIIQSAAAIGTADNVDRSTDILGLLMMQNGTAMTAPDGTASFDRFTPETQGQQLPPGAVALVFYNDFANPEKEVYTWNTKMPGSLQAFVEGKVGYFFGYAYHLPQIRALNPKLNFSIAPFPQIEGNKPVNFANYWAYAVSKKTQHVDEVWDFLQFMTKADQSQPYLTKAHLPTAQRSLINGQLEDLDLSVFAAEVPTARSWYHGTDAAATEQAFRDLINQATETGADYRKLIELTATKVNQTIK